jgi:hypothetical protein
MVTSAPAPHPYPPAQKKGPDWPGWIQVVLAVLGFLGLSGAGIAGWLHHQQKPIDPAPHPAVVSGAPGPGRSPTEGSTKPAADPAAVLVGDWSGNSQLSAYEQTSLTMRLTLRADGSYEWSRDVIHDSGFWEIKGAAIDFQQDSGGQYDWPWQLGTSGGRQVLKLQNEQGGIATLRRVR